MAGRRATTLAATAAVGLSVFGAVEAIDATVRLFRPAGVMAPLFDYPMWTMAHFVPGVLFFALCPFQLWAAFRDRHRVIHRWAGRLVVLSGIVLGVSGVIMPLTMERPFIERFVMTAFGACFLAFLGLAFSAAVRRDFATHRRWMIRTFAVGLTISSQRLWMGLFVATFEIDSVEEFWRYFVAAIWLAWGLQLAAAEWWVRRTGPRTRAAAANVKSGALAGVGS